MRGHWALVAMVVVLSVPAVAAADLPTGAEATRQAREAFAQGSRAFDLGKWDEAIDAWQRGYEIKPDPVFLYNIAQAERLTERYDKAIFFYKSYLRNSPNARNRAEVEQRIAQIEQLVEQKKATNESPPNVPLPPPSTGQGRPEVAHTPPPRAKPAPAASAKPPVSPPPHPATASVPPPSSSSPPSPTPPSSPPAASSSEMASAEPPPREQPAVESATPTETVVRPATPASAHRGDVTVTGGVNLWLGGVPGGAQPSTGLTVSGGYAVLARPAIELRLGALIGYTYLADIGTTDHFLSLMVDPKASFALWRQKLYAFVEVGVGAMVVSGVDKGSALLKANAPGPGTLAAFALRPALGLEYRLHPRVSLFLAPSLTYALLSQSSVTDSSLLQVDVSLGATLRL